MILRNLIFFLLIPFLINGQEKIALSVNINKVYEPSVGKEVFTGEHLHINEFFVPKYLYQKEKDKRGIIKDFVFKVVKEKTLIKSDLFNLDISKLSKNTQESLRIVKEGGKEFLSLEFNPIYVNDKGQFKQIESVEITYRISPSSKTKFSKVNQKSEIINSALNTGVWYKIAVDKTGVFKMDFNFLKSIGIDIENVNPKKIRVFGNGGAILPEILSTPRKKGLEENAIMVVGEDNNVFDKDDYILFYGEGPVSWKHPNRNNITHQQNIYSNYGYYFINVDSGIDGKRIKNLSNVNNAKTLEVDSYTDFQVHEKDLINHIRSGKQWYGEDFSVNNEQFFEFDFSNLIKTKEAIVDAAFSGGSRSQTVEYTVADTKEDGSEFPVFNVGVTSVSGVSGFNRGNGKNTFLPLGDLNRLKVTLDNKGDLSANAVNLDYLTVVADRSLVASGKQFRFLNFSSALTGEVIEYTIKNKNNINYVWNITDVSNIKNINNQDVSSSQFKFKEVADGEKDIYYVVKDSEAYSPINLGSETRIENQNLHGLKDVQYLIITSKELINQANRLRDYHRNNTVISEMNSSFINAEVIDLEKIYNEFGSGAADITAIRDFLKYVYDNASSEDDRLKYVCLFGDASFDYRGITYKDGNIVPAYSSFDSNDLTGSYSSDDYYGFLDETDDTSEDGTLSTSGKMEIITGRIPVKNTKEAEDYVDKILGYYSPKSFGDWKNKITLLGDDGQEGDDQSLIKFLENSALEIEKNNKDLNISKLYTDAFKEEVTSGGGAYPEIKKRFLESFNDGAQVINYFGHGNISALGQENFLDISDIRSIKNLNNLPLFITVTCDFSRFDDPTIVTGGEELITSPLGGAGSMITTTREIFITSGNRVNLNLADYLYSFDGKSRTVAEALRDVKNLNTIGSNRFFVYFLGDPAMKLSIPKKGVIIDKIEKIVKDEEGNFVSSTSINELQGLSRVKVYGRIVNTDLSTSNFSGDLSVVLFDQPIKRKTLLNEEGGVTTANKGSVVEFNSLENNVFRGDASVTDGDFSFEFVLPKDVSLELGEAKFSMYASSDKEERIGSDFSYKIGGIDPDVEEDKTPPTINLFMENTSFIDGGNTSSTPRLIIKFEDASGINTSLNSIGHNISLIIDGNLSNPISLNEFYSTEKDDFTKGIIDYELEELTEGNHTLTLKAWDTHNNSSTETLTFFVLEDDSKIKIDKVLNYPNPFINYTEFLFTNNKVGNELDVKIQIYTVSGKLVKTLTTLSRLVSSTDVVRSNDLAWDGKDDFGNRLAKGVYVYKITVKETISGETDERVEKLVIL